MKYTHIIIAFFCVMSACRNDSATNGIALPIQRIDQFTAQYSRDQSITDTLQPGLDIYISLMGLDPDNRDSALTVLRDSRVTQIFGNDIKSRFNAADSLSRVLGSMRSRLGEILPGTSIASVYGIASPYMQSVVVSDSIVLVALNHYLGSDYGGYATMPAYLTRLKTPARIPADVAEATVRVHFPYSPVEGTILERMLYEGAVTAAVAQTLGSEQEALGYSKGDMALANRNLKGAWQTLAAANMLYSTDRTVTDRLMEPSPFVKIENIEMPTKAGRYIGLRIIGEYLHNNPGATYRTLLDSCFYGQAQQRLIDSKFVP